MKSFNLVDEPWITTNRGVLSLRALFQESGTISLQENAIDRFCLLRFLIAVCQAACPLETEEEWDELDDDGLKAAVLRYLEKKKGTLRSLRSGTSFPAVSGHLFLEGREGPPRSGLRSGHEFGQYDRGLSEQQSGKNG